MGPLKIQIPGLLLGSESVGRAEPSNLHFNKLPRGFDAVRSETQTWSNGPQ